jgi:hypothetical protein
VLPRVVWRARQHCRNAISDLQFFAIFKCLSSVQSFKMPAQCAIGRARSARLAAAPPARARACFMLKLGQRS